MTTPAADVHPYGTDPTVFVLRYLTDERVLWDLAHTEHYICNGIDTIAYCDTPKTRRYIGQARAARGHDGHIPLVLQPADMTRLAAKHYAELEPRMPPFTDEELDSAAFLASFGDPRDGYELGLKNLRNLRPEWCDYLVDEKWEWHW